MRVSIRNSKGFSLVELMVVVAIIGILAAIAVPNFQKFAAKSKQSEARANLSALYSAERAFFSEWQQFYGDFPNIGYGPSGTLKYTHGFTAAGAAPTANWSGPAATAANSNAFCALAAYSTVGSANYCKDPNKGVAAAGETDPTGLSSAAKFTAAAVGDIGGAVTDMWTIDQSKNVLNTQLGI